MISNIHAIILLAIPVITVTAVIATNCKQSGPPPVFAQRIKYLSPFAVLGLLSALLIRLNGTPVSEWVVPALCNMLILVRCISLKIVRNGTATLSGASLLLCLSFGYMTDVDYTTTPEQSLAVVAANQATYLKNARKQLLQLRSDDTEEYSEISVATLEPRVTPTFAEGARVLKLWHTPFTRLHYIQRFRQDLWFPGGAISQGSQHLFLREQ